MRKCICGGFSADSIGEMEDNENPCICKDIRIKKLEADNNELSKMAKDYSVKAAAMERILAGEDVEQVIKDYRLKGE